MHDASTERITDTVQSTRFNYQLSIINTDRYTDVRVLLKGTLLVRDIYTDTRERVILSRTPLSSTTILSL